MVAPWIGIPTGGSSGQLRFALHRWDSLTASVVGLQQSEITGAEGVIHSCCTLPLHHVSGLMQFLRSLLSGGQLRLLPWALVKAKFQLASDPNSSLIKDTDLTNHSAFWKYKQFFLSLVPSQLQQLLAVPQAKAWLACFDTVLLGGAPAWPALLARARAAQVRLATTYGMTETGSQVVTLHPDDFLAGQSSCGKLLPHAQIEWISPHAWPDGIVSDTPFSREGGLSPKLLKVHARSLAWGYYRITTCSALDRKQQISQLHYAGQIELWRDQATAAADATGLLTDDLGYCDEQGYIYIVGRASTKIISGGENVFPAAVEAAILATRLVEDAVVLGVKDAQWGERVVAIVAAQTGVDVSATNLLNAQRSDGNALDLRISSEEVAQTSKMLVAQLAAAIAPALSPAQRPKQWLVRRSLPRNDQGKIQRRQLATWVRAQPYDSSRVASDAASCYRSSKMRL